MTTYTVLLKQDGGCDYTIACGWKWEYLKANSEQAAMKEAKSVVLGYNGDRQLSFAALLEVSDQIDLPIQLWYSELEQKEEEEDQKEHDEKEFERLKKKLKK